MVSNLRVGGSSGYVEGNDIRALKQPPVDARVSMPINARWCSTAVVILGLFSCGMRSTSKPADVHATVRSDRLPVVHTGRLYTPHSPPYKLSCSSSNIIIISQSKTLSPVKPQLIPGMSLSVCICLNWRPSNSPAPVCPGGDDWEPLRFGGDAMMANV